MSEYLTREKNTAYENNYPYREIITKAVCGTAKKIIQSQNNVVYSKNSPSKILGSKVTKFNINPVETDLLSEERQEIRVCGAFEVNLWYAFNEGKSTDVIRELFEFEEVLDIKDYDHQATRVVDTRIMITNYPDCKNVEINDNNTLSVDIELGLYVEIIGETMLYVRISDNDDDDS